MKIIIKTMLSYFNNETYCETKIDNMMNSLFNKINSCNKINIVNSFNGLYDLLKKNQ
jgi:hypothetical protein